MAIRLKPFEGSVELGQRGISAGGISDRGAM